MSCWLYTLDTGRKLNVGKTFRRRLGRVLGVLRPVSRRKSEFQDFIYILEAIVRRCS